MNEQRKIVVPSPENSETPLSEMQSWVTPNRLFFVRNHFDVPEMDAETWSLKIEGCVDSPLEINLDRLNAMPQRSVFCTMECAGNGRSFLQHKVDGVQWGAGAVGHAEWTGVPLKYLLEEAGLQPDAVEVIFEGADVGTEHDHPEQMNFERSLPTEKAIHPDTLLALRMNGEQLELSHGFPVRLLVPGWYGVVSVKWLTRVEVASTPFDGYFQNTKYTITRQTGRGSQVESVGAMPVKSEIIRPRIDEVLGIGTTRIFGLAWAGEDAVEVVEVSTDGGQEWSRAELIGPRAPYSWNLWEYLWEAGSEGEHVLLSRAISEAGRVQPIKHDYQRTGYLINFSRPTTVRIDSSRRNDFRPSKASSLEDEMVAFAEEQSKLKLDVEMEMELIYGAGI